MAQSMRKITASRLYAETVEVGYSLRAQDVEMGGDQRGEFCAYGARQLSGRTPDSQTCEPGFESPFATVWKIGHLRSLHWRPCWLSCINEYLAIDSGGNVSDLVLARNCCLARMLPGEAELVSEWTGLSGRAKVWSALSGPTDWILRYIKTTFTFTYKGFTEVTALMKEVEVQR